MKRKCSRLLPLAFLLLLLLPTLAACGSSNSGGGGNYLPSKQYTKDPADHTFSEQWEYDALTHWHPDSCHNEHWDFELMKDRAQHTLGTDNHCTVCDYFIPSPTDGSIYTFSLNADERSYTITGVKNDSVAYRSTTRTFTEPIAQYTEFSPSDATYNYLLRLPSYNNGLPVTGIAAGAFSEKHYAFSSLLIPREIKTLGERAFAGCDRLSVVLIQDGSPLAELPSGAFSGCTSLYEVKPLPNGALTTIGEEAFADCTHLTTIDLSPFDQLKTIEARAFRGCISLFWVTFPESLRTVGEDAFAELNIQSVKVKDLATWCKISFANKGANPAYQSSLYPQDGEGLVSESITLPAEITRIGDFAFCGFAELRRFALAEGSQLTEIGEGAFAECMLEKLSLNAKINKIAANSLADAGILNLEAPAAILPSLARSMRTDALRELTVSSGERVGGFANFTLLEKVTLADSVQVIESFAFSHCTALTEIKFPEGLEEIGEKAFSGCKSLVTVDFPNTAFSIGENAFSDCLKLGKLTLPAAVTSAADTAFLNSGVYIADIPAHLLNAVNLNTLRYLTVTDGNFLALSAAQIADGKWPAYQSSLTTVTLADTVVSIGPSVFENCYNITTFKMSRNLDEIGENAFRDCYVQNAIKWNGGLYLSSDLNEHLVFLGLESPSTATAVTVHGDTRFVVGSACKNAAKLASVTIGESLISLGENAFIGCTALTSLTFVRADGWHEDIDASSLNLSDASANAAAFKEGSAEIRHSY